MALRYKGMSIASESIPEKDDLTTPYNAHASAVALYDAGGGNELALTHEQLSEPTREDIRLFNNYGGLTQKQIDLGLAGFKNKFSIS